MADFRHIVRLRDTDLKGSYVVERALRNIKGIGHTISRAVRIQAGLPDNKKLGDLSDAEIKKLDEVISNFSSLGFRDYILNRRNDLESGENKHLTSTELVLESRNDIAFMKSIRSYKGIRHGAGLKVRGQRTKSTGRKGTSVGVRKKSAPAKAGGAA